MINGAEFTFIYTFIELTTFVIHPTRGHSSTQLTRGLFFNQYIYPLLHFLRTTKNMLKKKERKEQKKHYYSSARTICLLRKEQLPFLYAYILLQPYISPFYVGMYWKFCFTGEQKQLEQQIWHEFHPYVSRYVYIRCLMVSTDQADSCSEFHEY